MNGTMGRLSRLTQTIPASFPSSTTKMAKSTRKTSTRFLIIESSQDVEAGENELLADQIMRGLRLARVPSKRRIPPPILSAREPPEKVQMEPSPGSVTVVVRLILQKERSALHHASNGRMVNAVRSNAQTISMTMKFLADERIPTPIESAVIRHANGLVITVAHAMLVWSMTVASAKTALISHALEEVGSVGKIA